MPTHGFQREPWNSQNLKRETCFNSIGMQQTFHKFPMKYNIVSLRPPDRRLFHREFSGKPIRYLPWKRLKRVCLLEHNGNKVQNAKTKHQPGPGVNTGLVPHWCRNRKNCCSCTALYSMLCTAVLMGLRFIDRSQLFLCSFQHGQLFSLLPQGTDSTEQWRTLNW